MFGKKTIEDVELGGKRVLVRVDYNVPLDTNLNVTDNARIKLSLPTLNYLIS
ncbi:MAG: phosphoglycerate kinase, partial [Actinobacteria bacterium]|nr:phosphoglycerate kinase [Actinomycetota bacterium]